MPFVFLLSAVWGLAVAYNPGMALAKFGFVSGGLLVAYGLMRLPSRVFWRGREIPVLRAVIATTPALIAAYFLLANDWTQSAPKAPWLAPVQQAFVAFQAALGSAAPYRFLPAPHPNVVGGVLAMLLPLQAAALMLRSQPGGARAVRVTPSHIALVGLTVTALLTTRLRGAWLALVLAIAMGAAYRACLSVRHRRTAAPRVQTIVFAVALAAFVLTAVTWLWDPAWRASRPDRLLVWNNSWQLAWEYAFTGLGLASFTMPYSSYALLVHVPHTTHAHNLFLNIWLEQGPAGLMAFLGLAAGAVVPRVMREWKSPGNVGRWWHTAALISTLVILLHGMLDDPYYGYGGAGALLLFVPIALSSREPRRRTLEAPSRGTLHTYYAMAMAAVLLTVISLPATRALYHANLGTLRQTRAELAMYDWPAWFIQDEVRTMNHSGINEAIEHYRTALRVDPNNAVANRRLGQIQLSLGDYTAARARLETAHRASPAHPATRQMLGEAWALTGDVANAARIWRGLSLEQDQLAIRHAWYQRAADEAQASGVAEALLLVSASEY